MKWFFFLQIGSSARWVCVDAWLDINHHIPIQKNKRRKIAQYDQNDDYVDDDERKCYNAHSVN